MPLVIHEFHGLEELDVTQVNITVSRRKKCERISKDLIRREKKKNRNYASAGRLARETIVR